MRYAHQVCRETKAENSELKEIIVIRQCQQYYIRIFLDPRAYISGLPPKPKQNFNQRFGFKYDPAAPETPISGVSPQGKIKAEQNTEINEFYLIYFYTGVDLIDRLLSFDHRLRPTAQQALGKLSY